MDERVRARLPYRIEIEATVEEQVVQARNNGDIDMYFRVEIAHTGPVPASFVVSEIRLELPENAGDNDPALVLASLATNGSRMRGERST